ARGGRFVALRARCGVRSRAGDRRDARRHRHPHRPRPRPPCDERGHTDRARHRRARHATTADRRAPQASLHPRPWPTHPAPVNMMHRDPMPGVLNTVFSFPHLYTAELGYGNDAFGMTILLPERGANVDSVAAALTTDQWNVITAMMD